jgi:hypothetical protein
MMSQNDRPDQAMEYGKWKMKKGETGQPIPPFSFIFLAELLGDFLNPCDRHGIARHLAGDFEFSALILFALFERGLAQLIPLCIELVVLAVGVNAKPALEATGH